MYNKNVDLVTCSSLMILNMIKKILFTLPVSTFQCLADIHNILTTLERRQSATSGVSKAIINKKKIKNNLITNFTISIPLQYSIVLREWSPNIYDSYETSYFATFIIVNE